MLHDLFKELEDRRFFVEKSDLELRIKNKDHFRSFWLNMIILSSAVVVGILPLINNTTTPIKSLILTKLGLLIIALVCFSIILYFQDMLSRERDLSYDQTEFHNSTFSSQYDLLSRLCDEGRDIKEIERLFENTKIDAYHKEQEIIKQHLITGHPAARLFIDKYLNRFVSYGFILGVLLITLSFIL